MVLTRSPSYSFSTATALAREHDDTRGSTTIEGTSHAMRSERINATIQETGRNNVEIAVHSASLTGVSEGTKSFILLDFHSFASKLSRVASGVNPNHDFIVTYEMTEADDGALSHLLAGSFDRVEPYVLQEETAPPTRIASTTISTTALLNPLAQVRSSALELTPPPAKGVAMRLGDWTLARGLRGR